MDPEIRLRMAKKHPLDRYGNLRVYSTVPAMSTYPSVCVCVGGGVQSLHKGVSDLHKSVFQGIILADTSSWQSCADFG